MRIVQERVDSGQSPLKVMAGFRSFLEHRFANPPALMPEDQELVDRLSEQFIAYWPDDTPPRVISKLDPQLPVRVLSVMPNTGIEQVTVRGNSIQEPLQMVPGNLRPSLHLNLYPSIFNGLNKELDRYGVLLMPPQQTAPELFKWRLVTYITPRFDDYITGFVYSRVADDGSLQVEVDSNAVRLDRWPLRTDFDSDSFSFSDWMVLFYSLVLCALLLLILLLRPRLFAGGVQS